MSNPLEIFTIPVTPFQQNCRVVSDGEGGALVIDPGGEAERILSFVHSRELEVKEVWLTHAHLDHCGGVKNILDATGATLTAHKIEEEFRANVPKICAMYGIPQGDMKACPEPERYVEGGEELPFGDYRFEVFFTPGHSPGHVCFYYAPEKILLAGDTLFEGSIGRTDLPGGDHATLIRSIREILFSLPGETRVLCGHGPDTTIGVEKKSNPFVGGV